MKERTLKSDKKKEYKTAGVQTESIPELVPLTRPLRRLDTWYTWRNRKKATKDDLSDLSDDETPPPPPPSHHHILKWQDNSYSQPSKFREKNDLENPIE